MPIIALVDDDHNILTSVSIALEAEGYRIMTYSDGASALESFKMSTPDLAILDIKMPRMDGIELLQRLRQKSDIPLIFLTSKEERTILSANPSHSDCWSSVSRRYYGARLQRRDSKG